MLVKTVNTRKEKDLIIFETILNRLAKALFIIRFNDTTVIQLQCTQLSRRQIAANHMTHGLVRRGTRSVLASDNLLNAFFDDLILMPQLVLHFLKSARVHLANGVTLQIVVVYYRSCPLVRHAPTHRECR